MGWKDKLLRVGSYRGAEFFIRSHSLVGGNRTAVHEFLQRDDPFLEQFGNAPNLLAISGYVIETAGEDYFVKRDRLLAALQFQDRRGVDDHINSIGGVLDHPYLGRKRAILQSFRMTENAREGRIARFSMAFIEAPAGVGLGAIETAPEFEVQAAADELTLVAGDELEAELETMGPQQTRDATANGLRDLSGAISGLNVFNGIGREVEAFGRDVRNLATSASSLATAPATLAFTVLETISGIERSVANARASLFAYEALLGFASAAPTGINAGNESPNAAANRRAVDALVRSSVVAGFARSAMLVEWAFRDEATRARDVLLAAVDSLAESASMAHFEALAALRAQVVQALPPPGESLPELSTLELLEPTSSAVLSYRLYGTPDRDFEIDLRNRLREPGIIPAGQALEILDA